MGVRAVRFLVDVTTGGALPAGAATGAAAPADGDGARMVLNRGVGVGVGVEAEWEDGREDGREDGGRVGVRGGELGGVVYFSVAGCPIDDSEWDGGEEEPSESMVDCVLVRMKRGRRRGKTGTGTGTGKGRGGGSYAFKCVRTTPLVGARVRVRPREVRMYNDCARESPSYFILPDREFDMDGR